MASGLVSVLVVVAIVLLFAIPISHALRKTRERTDALRRAAAELGLNLLPKGDGQTLKDLGSYHLFSQGNSRTIRNMLWGKADGLEIKVFDYDYSVGGEESRESPSQTAVLFRSPELDLPAFA